MTKRLPRVDTIKGIAWGQRYDSLEIKLIDSQKNSEADYDVLVRICLEEGGVTITAGIYSEQYRLVNEGVIEEVVTNKSKLSVIMSEADSIFRIAQNLRDGKDE